MRRRGPSRQSAGKVKYPPRPTGRPGPRVIRGGEERQRVDPGPQYRRGHKVKARPAPPRNEHYAYPRARSCRGCIGKQPYHIWLIIVDRSKDFVHICSSVDRFAGCFLQIRPQPFGVPTQLSERGCPGGHVENELPDIINHSIKSLQFLLAF